MTNLSSAGPRRLAMMLVAAAAVAAALLPIPADTIERHYSMALYPRIQRVLTPLSNAVPIFFLDLAIAVLLVAAFLFVRRRVRVGGWPLAARASAMALVVLASALYLLFLITWGLNYRRVPLEQKLAYDSGRVTRDEAVDLGHVVVRLVNEAYGPAHAGASGPALQHAFTEALAALGHSRPTVPGIPKHSLLSFYFRYAGVDGMTDPFFLDVVINPDALAMERPQILAHEWAHLAGYADEAEANFIAWLACVRGDAMARYSGWLSLYSHLSASLPVADRRALSTSLGEGPRADLRAMAERHARGSRTVQRAQRQVYDAYLRANRIEEGIARYNAVARLVIGTQFDPNWIPRRRES